MTALPNRDRRAERRAATRREILDAAWEIARRNGLAAITLREVGELVGMRAPSLYSHFDSKSAIYDAMFAQAWQEWADMLADIPLRPTAPRRTLLRAAETFFEFSVNDLARYQLMNQAVIHGFTPSEDAYAESMRAYEQMAREMLAIGVRSAADLDLWTSLLAGAIDQQLANDRNGTRWRRQLPRLVDMFADEVGIAGPPLRRRAR
jgi:AcrR family transcriptional regulator